MHSRCPCMSLYIYRSMIKMQSRSYIWKPVHWQYIDWWSNWLAYGLSRGRTYKPHVSNSSFSCLKRVIGHIHMSCASDRIAILMILTSGLSLRFVGHEEQGQVRIVLELQVQLPILLIGLSILQPVCLRSGQDNANIFYLYTCHMHLLAPKTEFDLFLSPAVYCLVCT